MGVTMERIRTTMRRTMISTEQTMTIVMRCALSPIYQSTRTKGRQRSASVRFFDILNTNVECMSASNTQILEIHQTNSRFLQKPTRTLKKLTRCLLYVDLRQNALCSEKVIYPSKFLFVLCLNDHWVPHQLVKTTVHQ
jgi:hypothetical protein